MKKFFTTFIFIIAIFIFVANTNTYADTTSYIKIGLQGKNLDKSSIKVGNQSLDFYNTGCNVKLFTATSNGGFDFYYNNQQIIKINIPYSNFDSAFAEASVLKARGLNTGVYMDNNNNYCVVLMGYSNTSDSTISHVGGTSVYAPSKKLLATDSNGIVIIFEDLSLVNAKASYDPFITIGDRQYRGFLQFGSNVANTIIPVIYLDIEEYLYGVVPSEMPPSWAIEALKAQSVAARTYTKANLNKHSSGGYNLCDTVHCQAFSGVAIENFNSTSAVNLTKGVCAYYDNKLISTVFSSSNGGVSANAEDVWQNPLPYLLEKVDPYDKEGKVWSRTLSLEDIKAICAIKNVNIGDVVRVEITSLSPNGRVNGLNIVGTTGIHSLEKENIRYFFSDGANPSLESRYMQIQNGQVTQETTAVSDIYVYENGVSVKKDMKDIYILENDVIKQNEYTTITVKDKNGSSIISSIAGASNISIGSSGDYVTFSGKGYGHGVGMSQYGAKGMAEAGFNYVDILKFYYTGIDVR